MTAIESIQVNLQTGHAWDAGSDGDAYLGFAAREYYLQRRAEDLARGASDDYVFGDNANVNNPAVNDPRDMLVQAEEINNFPIYIRFYPEYRNDRWQLLRAVVGFNGEQFPMWDTLTVVDYKTGVWMGVRSTLFLHFLQHQD